MVGGREALFEDSSQTTTTTNDLYTFRTSSWQPCQALFGGSLLRYAWLKQKDAHSPAVQELRP